MRKPLQAVRVCYICMCVVCETHEEEVATRSSTKDNAAALSKNKQKKKVMMIKEI